MLYLDTNIDTCKQIWIFFSYLEALIWISWKIKGYDHCGHGNWIQIRDDFVPTRTNKQICSHALMCFGPEHFKLMKQKRKATTTTRSRTAIKSKSTGKKLPKKQKFDADDEELSDSEDVTNQYHRTDHGYSNTGGGNNHGGTQV